MKRVLPILIALMLWMAGCNSDNEPTTPEGTPSTEQPEEPGNPGEGEEGEGEEEDPVVEDEPEETLTDSGTGEEAGLHIQRQVLMPFGKTITGFYEALPSSYATSNLKYPLLIFFGGAGERGNGTSAQLASMIRPNAPTKMLHQGRFPKHFLVQDKYYTFVVLSVQSRNQTRASPKDVESFIKYALQNYRIDTTRVYLTGLSLGGGILWDYVAANVEYAKRISAATPMAGYPYPPTREKAQNMANAKLKVWAFHNDMDNAVPPSLSKDYVRWINEFAPGTARLTLFESEEHDCWTKSYNPAYTEKGYNIYEWMLTKRRKD